MSYNCNEWSYSTPSQVSNASDNDNNNNNNNNESLWTASTGSIGSILRSSSRYTTSKLDSTQCGLTKSCKKKKVRIVSPLKWDIDNKSDESLALKREFINTTISYCDLKQILRNLGCDTRGCYDECVNRLLSTKWIPDRQYIEYNEKLRAKPIHDFNERVIKLENGEMDYLQRFTINELKKWLKYNNIQQPHGATKQEYIKLINIHFLWRSPSPDSFRFKVRPNRPCHDKTKTMSRTPRARQKTNNGNVNNMNVNKSKLDFDEYVDDGMDGLDGGGIDNNTDNDNDNEVDMMSQSMDICNEYDQGVRMQLCFED